MGKSKGQDTETEIGTQTLKVILQEYASAIISSKPDEILFNEIISTHSTIYDPLAVRKALLRTGIVVERYNVPEFFHQSFLEYFCAKKFQEETSENLSDIIKKNCDKKEFYDIFQYLSGLLISKEKQNIVLDCLEELNLDLYWNCLNVRYRDISICNEEESRLPAEAYLAQLRKSYIRILSNHFSSFIPLIDPLKNVINNTTDIADVCIKGSIDFNIPSIDFSLFIPENRELINKVIITKHPDQPTLTAPNANNKKNNSIPIISLPASNFGGHDYYNLKLSNLGIDSAREIAFKKIKSQLYDLLDKNIPVIKETYPMILEQIESIFYELRYYQFLIPEPLRNLSLHNNLEETLETIKEHKDYSGIQFTDDFILPIDFNGIYLLLNEIEIDCNINNYLLPSADLDFDDLGKGSAYNWELYSKDQLKHYFRKLYDWFQDGYRLLAENLFPTLKNRMSLYSCGPVRYSINILLNHQSPFNSGVYITWEPITTGEDRSTIVKIIEDNEKYNHPSHEKDIELRLKLEMLGRFPKSISYGQSSLLTIYFEKQQILRKKVYKYLEKDLKQIIGE